MKLIVPAASMFVDSLAKDDKQNVYLLRDSIMLYAAEKIKRGTSPKAWYLSKDAVNSYAQSLTFYMRYFDKSIFDQLKAKMGYTPKERIPESKHNDFLKIVFDHFDVEYDKEEGGNDFRRVVDSLKIFISNNGIDGYKKKGVRFIDTSLQGSFNLLLEYVVAKSTSEISTESYMFFSNLSDKMSFLPNSDNDGLVRSVELVGYPVRFGEIKNQMPMLVEVNNPSENSLVYLSSF